MGWHEERAQATTNTILAVASNHVSSKGNTRSDYSRAKYADVLERSLTHIRMLNIPVATKELKEHMESVAKLGQSLDLVFGWSEHDRTMGVDGDSVGTWLDIVSTPQGQVASGEVIEVPASTENPAELPVVPPVPQSPNES